MLVCEPAHCCHHNEALTALVLSIGMQRELDINVQKISWPQAKLTFKPT